MLVDSKCAHPTDYAETARSSGDALLTIINDILDFSKIEAGKLSIDAFPFSLPQLIDEVADMLAPKAQERGIDVLVRYAPGTPTRLVGDADRIRQIVANLVSNAVKFTHRGHVLVSVDCATSADAQADIRVAVTDTGIGIAKGKLGTLFEKFSQADTSVSRRYGGTGLGLAISKRLVELMGGSIHGESEEGKGSTFWFSLTLPCDEQSEEPPASAAVLEGLRVLIVDGNEINRRVIYEQIASWGMRNGSYATAEDALDAVRAAHAAGDPYEIMIADYRMPGMSGAALAAAMNDEPALRDVLFVMLTSIGDWKERHARPDRGIDACLLKPVRHTRLRSTLAVEWVRKRASRDIARRPASAEPLPPHTAVRLGEGPAQRSTGEFAGLSARVLVVEDNPVNQKVAVMLLAKLGVRADVAGHGREAIDMLRLLPYDLVFMDCQMPEMDGFEATAEIRRVQGTDRHVPIIAMTADVMEATKDRCAAAGMDDFLPKPVSGETLARVLRNWLRTAPHNAVDQLSA